MSQPRQTTCLVSCEHGGNEIPREFLPLFAEATDALQSHRGYDLGSLPLARRIADRLRSPLFFSTQSRLLIDLNRSLHADDLFSEWTRKLSADEQQQIIDRWYRPYRAAVTAEVARQSQLNRVLHLSIHTFTPVWEGVERSTDVGLLFDPDRPSEVEFCCTWKRRLEAEFPNWHIDDNLPYQGTADGFTTTLRTQFSTAVYTGIELEVNQKHFANEAQTAMVIQGIVSSLTDMQAAAGVATHV